MASIAEAPSAAMPVLSLKERDRRWAVLRAMMRERNLDCLFVSGFRSREQYESYITDDYIEGSTVFPLEGEPVTLTFTGTRVFRALTAAERGCPLWVKDYRVAATGSATAAVVKEKGLERGRIGVVGLHTSGPAEAQGVVASAWWQDFTEALPFVQFEPVDGPFCELMLPKSEEELALIRYAAETGELCAQAMLDATEPGIGEEVIYAEIMRAIHRRGMGLHYPTLILHSGPANLAWGPPRWLTRAEPPRRVERGDMVQAEIMPAHGNLEIQVQMSVALDPVDEINHRCETVARAAYDAGLKALRPGVAFAEVLAAMEEPFRSAGCWGLTPLLHSVNPQYLVGVTAVNRDKLADDVGRIESRSPGPASQLRVKPGMVFVFEPNACIGHHRVNLGGSVAVTESGCEELNEISTRTRHK